MHRFHAMNWAKRCSTCTSAEERTEWGKGAPSYTPTQFFPLAGPRRHGVCQNWLLAFECVIPSVLAGDASVVALSGLRDIAALLSAWVALDGVRSTTMRQIFRDWCARSVEPVVIAFQSLLPIETILCLRFVLCFCGCSLRFVELCFWTFY